MTREEWRNAELVLKATLNKLWPGGKSAQDRVDDVMWEFLNRNRPQ